MSVPSESKLDIVDHRAVVAGILKSFRDFAAFGLGSLSAGAMAFAISVSAGAKHNAPVAPVEPPAPVAPVEIKCQCGTAKTSRQFRVTCPTCHYDLTVVPPILPTGDFGKVAKTGTGELPK